MHDRLGLSREITSKEVVFGEQIKAITRRELTAENISTYADNALDDLIQVVQDIVTAYENQPTVMHLSRRDAETAAFEYFGLQPQELEATLDHIATTADEIRGIDRIIGKIITKKNQVIVPPDSMKANIEPGNGSFEAKQTIPRLKTLLFILAKEFEVDLNDTNQVMITTGLLTESMMREESYNLVEIPTINRTVLVCDEVGNVTYVFDDDVLKQYEISPSDISGLSKSDVDDLISSDDSMGCRVVYTNKYVTRMIAALSASLNMPENEIAPERSGQYLQKPSNAPEGILSARGIREMLDVHPSTLGRAIEALRDELGEVHQYRFYSKRTQGYDDSQVALIKMYLDQHGLLVPNASEEVLSFSRLKDKLGVSPATLKDAIETLGEQLGPVKRYRIGSKRRPAEGYDEVQQDVIAEYLTSLGKLKPPAPEGVLSLSGMTRSLGVDRETLETAIAILWNDSTVIPQYKFGATTTYGFDEARVAAIKRYLEEYTSIFAETAPEGYMTISGFTKHMRTNYNSVIDAIDALGEELGEPVIFRVNDQPSKCYSPMQLQKIRAFLEDKGFFADDAPEGFIATSRLARELHVNHPTVKKAIEKLGEDFGEMKKYRFRSIYTEGMSPEQQAMVRTLLNRDKFEPAPNGFLSKNGMAKKLGIDVTTIRRALGHVKDELGEVKKYKFRHVTTDGYDERQQEIIALWLKANAKRVKTSIGATATMHHPRG